jgi:hypothetical protein
MPVKTAKPWVAKARTQSKGSPPDDAWRCISEAMMAVKTTKESWYELADFHITNAAAYIVAPVDRYAAILVVVKSVRCRRLQCLRC